MNKILKSNKIKQYVIEQNLLCCPISSIKGELVLDHCHSSGRIRKPINRNINRWLGKIENNFLRYVSRDLNQLPDLLRNIADYLDNDYSSNPIHYKHINKVVNKYMKLPIEEQRKILQDNNLDYNNLKIRKLGFRKLIINSKLEII